MRSCNEHMVKLIPSLKLKISWLLNEKHCNEMRKTSKDTDNGTARRYFQASYIYDSQDFITAFS